ncbi:OLC1v1004629C1 [Oldenlandia corymbosa var. corymbosa]|uniref:OLC1v1004629C1 n=1 Tax=Oldenlandia corymbosa var. corymbosa TaxID=529605 RepID=A0AAV1DER2_OLDCO|nr:OLC1v1004629C1 [Oldenlandia corymbosa var. corymbosa]
MTEVLHSSSSSSSPSISTPTHNGALFRTQSFMIGGGEEQEEEIVGVSAVEGSGGIEAEEEEGEGDAKDRENKERRANQLSLIALLVTLFRKSFWMACKATTGRDELCNGGANGGGMEIGWPTNVRHVAHVTFDRFNGFLGLPVEFEPDVPRRAPSASATVFGVSTESMQLSFDTRGNSVPTILILMQRRLYAQGGLQAEGIFRINAENSQEEYVRNQLNRGNVPEDIDVHCLAGLIKAWFRELPKGVLDPISPEQIMQCQSQDDCAALVRLLPPSEAALLDWAINLMADVVQMEHVNKMNSRNIAMVFAPNMTHMADPLTALMYAVQVMNFLKTLIEKTLKDREDSVVGQASTSDMEPFDDDGHQSPGLRLSDFPESNYGSERLSIGGPVFDTASESNQGEHLCIEGYLTSSTSPEEYSDESGSCGTPVQTYSITNTRESGRMFPRAGSVENSQEVREGQSSDSDQMNSSMKMNEHHPVSLGIGIQSKSKGMSNLSRIDSLTERIEAWR